MLPLIGVKEILKGGIYMGLVHYATSHNYPLIIFSVEENAVFIHEFSKNLPTVGAGTPPPTPPPPPPRSLGLGRFAPSHITAPLRLNPGYATAPNNAFSEFCRYIWNFVGTCKPTSMSFVPTKFLKYQQNIERNSTFIM